MLAIDRNKEMYAKEYCYNVMYSMVLEYLKKMAEESEYRYKLMKRLEPGINYDLIEEMITYANS